MPGADDIDNKISHLDLSGFNSFIRELKYNKTGELTEDDFRELRGMYEGVINRKTGSRLKRYRDELILCSIYGSAGASTENFVGMGLVLEIDSNIRRIGKILDSKN